jgi:hypothetical protein
MKSEIAPNYNALQLRLVRDSRILIFDHRSQYCIHLSRFSVFDKHCAISHVRPATAEMPVESAPRFRRAYAFSEK